MAAALARFSSISASSRPISCTKSNILGRGGVSLTQSNLKRSRLPSPFVPRTFASHNNGDESPRRNRPRIHLSREQIRRLWEALGEGNETDCDVKVDRIPVDADRFPMALFENDDDACSFLFQGRISVNPKDFPLAIFEDSERTFSCDRVEDRHDEQALERVFDPKSMVAAWEEEMEWYLKRARRDGEPHRFVEKAQGILEHWHMEAQKSTSCSSPSWQAHEDILRGWKRIGLESYDPHAAEQADKVLQLLLKLVDRKEIEIKGPLHVLFTWVMRMWLRAPQSHNRGQSSSSEHSMMVAKSLLESTTRASELLLQLEQRSDIINDEKRCKPPDNSAYIAILNAFNNASMAASKVGLSSRKTDAKGIYNSDAIRIAEMAARGSEDVLMRMEKRAQVPAYGLSPPNIYDFRAVVSTWTNANTRQGLSKAHKLTSRMEDARHLQDSAEILCYRKMLEACARISRLEEYDAEDSEAPANKALSLLIRMDPELLSRLDLGYVSFLAEDVEHPDKCLSRVPLRDAICYGMVIQTLAQTDVGTDPFLLNVTPAMLAETVLDRMEELCSTGELDTAPNSHCYGNVIRAYSLWANRSADKSVLIPRVERILKRLEEHILRGEQISANTDEVTRWCNQAMRILAEKTFGGSPSRANEFLKRMEELYVSTGWSRNRTFICPDESSYCIILSALEATSGDLQAARDAVNVLHRMRAMHERQRKLKYGADRNQFLCRPSTVAYNIVLRTCASITAEGADKQEAFQFASQVFDELQTCLYTSSNSASYASIIEAHANLLSAGSERDESISKVFRLCRDEGKLDKLVTKAVREACTEDVAAVILDSSPSAT